MHLPWTSAKIKTAIAIKITLDKCKHEAGRADSLAKKACWEQPAVKVTTS